VSRLRIFGQPERRGDGVAGIERFNRLSSAQARKALHDCCGSKQWVERMIAQRPFRSVNDLLETADKTWTDLSGKDWLEAFRHHPPIGGTRANGKQSSIARKWSSGEQSTAQKAAPETRGALAVANRAYQKTFGHVFLICASGKTSEEVLKSLEARLSNNRESELRIAAEEQGKITRLRLEKLLGS
jgi:OHCU decarboxylase